LIEQYQDEIALIRYHTAGDPFYEYNPEENAERIDYYFGTSNSHLFIDGIVDAGYWHDPWEDYFLARMEVTSPLDITIGGSYDSESRYLDLGISVTATDEIVLGDLRLQCVMIENGIYWQAPNGLEYHNQTMRDMIPDGQGETFSIENGQTVDFVRQFYIDEELDADSCEMVVFVQAHQAMEVLQASKVKIPDLTETMAYGEPGELPSAFRLYPSYPNPFNAKTRILYDLIEASEVRVEIYDVTGRRMACLFSGAQQPGEHSVIWDASGFSSGIYFARLEAGRLSKNVKMVLLK
jgi:hypothetical protein